jgi:chromosome segregation protein
VREVLEASAQGNLPVEVLGLTADHLEVKPGAEPVVEAALGADLQALLTPDGRAARALSQWVEEAGLGRLRILALDELASRLEAAPRGSSPLAGVVRPEPGFEPLAALLAGAGWCADLEAAWTAARSMDPGQVVVTPAVDPGTCTTACPFLTPLCFTNAERVGVRSWTSQNPLVSRKIS